MSSDSGLLVVDKPAGWTSHQVVGRARRTFGTRKVGHAGTLDPMATGVLILGVNRATRLLGHLALHDKAYEATIRLGESTNTDDAEGEVISSASASGLTEADLEPQIAALTGEIWQTPSSFSAIKVNGQRAYALARKGHEIDLPQRQVSVTEFTVTGLHPVGELLDVSVRVTCSSGTYVRALARDLGAGLGVGGHLTMLRRTRIGRYDISDAQSLEDSPRLMSMAEAAALSFPCVTLDEAQSADVRYGRSLPLDVPADPTGLLAPSGQLLALYRPDPDEAGRARPVAVLV